MSLNEQLHLIGFRLPVALNQLKCVLADNFAAALAEGTPKLNDTLQVIYLLNYLYRANYYRYDNIIDTS